MLDVLFFTTSESRSPIRDFIRQQSPETRRKILRTIDLLREHGLHLPGNHLKRMSGTKELWELRVKTQGTNYRIFFARVEDTVILLLHAVTKKRQKTAQKDIQTASRRLDEYKTGAKGA